MKHGGDDDYNGTHHFVLPLGGSDHGEQVEDTTIATATFPSTASISSISVQMSGGGGDVMNNKQYQQQEKPRKKRSCSRMMRMENKSAGVAKVAKKAADTNMSRQCTECGKKFWSWKALFGHMRCHPERQWRGINPPPNFRRPFSHQMGYEEDEAMEWRRIPASQNMMGGEDDYEVAACLLLLANAGHGTGVPNTSVGLEAKDDNGPPACSKLDDEEETACAAAVSGGDNNIHVENAASIVDIATTTTMLNNIKCCSISRSSFECSSCKKVFGSHQALGGHRASHKNVKGCFAINKEDYYDSSCSGVGRGDDDRSLINDDDSNELGEDSCSGFNNNKALLMEDEGHRCSICLRVFSSGQALGGHKRCHWDRFGHPSSLLPTVAHQHPNHNKDHSGCLDLNFPTQHHNHPNLDLRLTL